MKETVRYTTDTYSMFGQNLIGILTNGHLKPTGSNKRLISRMTS